MGAWESGIPVTNQWSYLWSGILTDITERVRLEQELEQLAKTDALTGLINRRHFLELAELELARSRRYNNLTAIMMMDIDFFKSINDTYGHKAGDLVLQKLATTCKDVLREVDLIGRMGERSLLYFFLRRRVWKL